MNSHLEMTKLVTAKVEHSSCVVEKPIKRKIPCIRDDKPKIARLSELLKETTKYKTQSEMSFKTFNGGLRDISNDSGATSLAYCIKDQDAIAGLQYQNMEEGKFISLKVLKPISPIL